MTQQRAEGPGGAGQSPPADAVTAEEIRLRYALTASMIRNWTHQGKLRVIGKIGQYNLYNRSEVEAAIRRYRSFRPKDEAGNGAAE